MTETISRVRRSLAGLPLMDRVGREAGWEKADRTCAVCNTGAVETVEHFVLHCDQYASLRHDLHTRLREIMARFSPDRSLTFKDFTNSSTHEQFLILMGKRLNNPALEKDIDMAIKRFLKKAWHVRRPVTDRTNEVMGREDYSSWHLGISQGNKRQKSPKKYFCSDPEVRKSQEMSFFQGKFSMESSNMVSNK